MSRLRGEIGRDEGRAFERIGLEAMRSTNDERQAQEICSLYVQSLRARLEPRVQRTQEEVQDLKTRGSALCSHLYDRPVPASDARIMALNVAAWFLWSLLVVAIVASSTSHATTLQMLGWTTAMSVVVGLALTGIAAVVGHRAFEEVLTSRQWLQGVVAIAALGCLFSGLFDIARSRALMSGQLHQSSATQSFVDGPTTAAPPSAESQSTAGTLEQKVRRLMGWAWIKVMLATDLVLGILLGLIARIRTDPDVVAWREMKSVKKVLLCRQERYYALTAVIENARHLCQAGICRGKALVVGSHDLSPPDSHELSPPGCRGRVTGFKLPWWFSAVQSSSRV